VNRESVEIVCVHYIFALILNKLKLLTTIIQFTFIQHETEYKTRAGV